MRVNINNLVQVVLLSSTTLKYWLCCQNCYHYDAVFIVLWKVNMFLLQSCLLDPDQDSPEITSMSSLVFKLLETTKSLV